MSKHMDSAKRLQFMKELDLKAWDRLPPSAARLLGAMVYGSTAEFNRTQGGLFSESRYLSTNMELWDHPEYFVISREWRWEYEVSVYKSPWIVALQPYSFEPAELDRLRLLCQIYHRGILVLPQWNWYGYGTQFLLLGPLQWINRYSEKLQHRLGGSSERAQQ